MGYFRHRHADFTLSLLTLLCKLSRLAVGRLARRRHPPRRVAPADRGRSPGPPKPPRGVQGGPARPRSVPSLAPAGVQRSLPVVSRHPPGAGASPGD